MDVKTLTLEINAWATRKGWNEHLDVYKALLSLHDEVSEAWRELRENRDPTDVYYTATEFGDKPEGFSIEVADIVIRALHLFAYYDIDPEEAIAMKMLYNEKRPYRHGGKLA